MINAIAYSINELKRVIPIQLLQMAFLRGNNAMYANLDQLINNNVIQSGVLLDCGIAGGKHKQIPLLIEYAESCDESQLGGNQMLGQYSIYRIPPQARENVSIQAIVNLSRSHMMGRGLSDNCNLQGMTVGGLAHEMLQSHTMSSMPSLPIPKLLSGDIIKITPAQHTHNDYILTVKLALDSELTNLHNSAIMPFSDLVEYKTKMYVYNTLIIEIDKGYISGGAEIGAIKDVIDTYSDAKEVYREKLLQWRGAMSLDSDTTAMLFTYMV